MYEQFFGLSLVCFYCENDSLLVTFVAVWSYDWVESCKFAVLLRDKPMRKVDVPFARFLHYWQAREDVKLALRPLLCYAYNGWLLF